MGDRINETTIIIKKRVYGWSKYGGSRDNVRKEQLPTWFCQVCSREQVRILPQYMIPTDEDNMEYVRVCSKCKNVYERNFLNGFEELVAIVRMPKQIVQLANQATIPLRY